jgi:hypothetical protein
LPTPNAGPQNDNDSTWEQRRERLKAQHKNGNGFGMKLAMAASLVPLPTPQAHDVTTRWNTEADGHYYPHDLSNAAGNNDYSRRIVELATVPTPNAMEGGQTSRNGKLHSQANLSAVATPKVRDIKSPSASAEFLAEQMAHPRGKDLSVQATYFFPVAAPTCPAPHDSDQTAGKGRPRKGYGEDLAIQANQYDPGVDPDGSTRSRLDQLPRQAQLADSGPTATGGTGATGSSGRLNPAFSRWLMGYPIEWDCCGGMVTRLSRRSRRSS